MYDVYKLCKLFVCTDKLIAKS